MISRLVGPLRCKARTKSVPKRSLLADSSRLFCLLGYPRCDIYQNTPSVGFSQVTQNVRLDGTCLSETCFNVLLWSQMPLTKDDDDKSSCMCDR